MIVSRTEAAQFHREVGTALDLCTPEVRDQLREALALKATDYIRGLRLRGQPRENLVAATSGVDVLCDDDLQGRGAASLRSRRLPPRSLRELHSLEPGGLPGNQPLHGPRLFNSESEIPKPPPSVLPSPAGLRPAPAHLLGTSGRARPRMTSRSFRLSSSKATISRSSNADSVV